MWPQAESCPRVLPFGHRLASLGLFPRVQWEPQCLAHEGLPGAGPRWRWTGAACPFGGLSHSSRTSGTSWPTNGQGVAGAAHLVPEHWGQSVSFPKGCFLVFHCRDSQGPTLLMQPLPGEMCPRALPHSCILNTFSEHLPHVPSRSGWLDSAWASEFLTHPAESRRRAAPSPRQADPPRTPMTVSFVWRYTGVAHRYTLYSEPSSADTPEPGE